MDDINCIMKCRSDQNRLDFACQLAFVRSINRFPAQEPLEIEENILTFASIQLCMDIQDCWQYGTRQRTISEHQDAIRDYLGLQSFNAAIIEVEAFLIKEAFRLEQTASLIARLKEFLKTHCIVEPAQDTLIRTVQTQRETARTAIYEKVAGVMAQRPVATGSDFL